MSPAAIEALLLVLEAAAKAVPHIIEAIETHDHLSDSSKADLIARVKAARAKVVAHEPRELPPT